MNNKKIILTAISTTFLVMVTASALAFTFDIRQGTTQIMMWIEDFVSPVAWVLLGGGEFLFERILLVAIILCFTALILEKIPIFKEKNAGARWVVAVAVSLLAARFGFQYEFLRIIFLPYTVLGVVLSAGVPIIIFFFFVKEMESSTMRKIMWLLAAVVFIGVWASRYGELGAISWVYFWTAVAALILMLSDGTIRRMMINEEWKQLGLANRDALLREVQRDLRELENDHRTGIVSEGMYERIKHKLEAKLHSLMKK